MSEIMQNKLTLRKVVDLIPYARNARKHDDNQVNEIVASMLEFCYTNPVLADSKGIVAGHGRTLAVGKIYSAGNVLRLPDGTELPIGYIPVVDCEGWSETRRKAYILADNKIAINSDWDTALLKLELEDLSADGFDLSLTGFDDIELAELFSPEPEENEKDPNSIPKTPDVPHSKMGDMWILGAHRVRCGDSTKIEDWNALMMGEIADIQFCDPPYNVAYESKLAGAIKNDSMDDKNFYDFLFGFYSSVIKVMKPGAAIYVSYADFEGKNFYQAFIDAGFKLASCLIWVKNSLVMSRGDFHSKHEPILYGWKSGGKHKWWGGRKQTTVQELGDQTPFQKLPDGRFALHHGDSVMYVSGDAVIEQVPSTIISVDKPKRSALHPTTKPTELVERLLVNNARANDIVIDGFGGSGTTLIAAERLGMCARLQEHDEKFVDVICARYYEYTGRLPVHAETQQEFPRERLEELLAR